jgi:hypothetical protein
VEYVPDVATHWNDADEKGNHLFQLVYDGGDKDGQPVADAERSARGLRRVQGELKNSKGERVKVGAPIRYLDAVIVDMDSQTFAATLTIVMPNAQFTGTYPNVPYSAVPVSHSWHEKAV